RYDNLAVGLEGDIAQLLARAGAECDDSTGTEARVEATITVITHQSGSARAVVVQHAGDNDAAVGLNGECTGATGKRIADSATTAEAWVGTAIGLIASYEPA